MLKKQLLHSHLIFLAIVQILENYCYHSLKISKFSLNPQIWLSGYRRVDSDDFKISNSAFKYAEKYSLDDNIVKNGSVYTVLGNGDLWKVYFICEAYYPIRWSIPHPQQFGKAEHIFTTSAERTSYFNDELDKPVNNKYSLQLEITTSSVAFFAGNFTCESFRNETKHSSIYVFVEGDEALENQKASLFINVTLSKKKHVTEKIITLPCRPGLPNLEILLFKEKGRSKSNKKKEWIPLPVNDSISFNPAFGFLMKIKSTPSNVWGTYKCQLADDEDVFVIYELRPGDELNLNKLKFQPKHTLKSQDAHVSLKNGLIQCCTGKAGQYPEGSTIQCLNENHCNLIKSVFLYNLAFGNDKLYTMGDGSGGNESGCGTIQMYFSSEVVFCKSPELDIAAQYIRVYGSDEQIPNKTTEIYPAVIPLVWSAENIHLHDLADGTPLPHEKIIFRFAKPLTGKHFYGTPYSAVKYFLHSPDYEMLYSDNGLDENNKITYLSYHKGDIYEGESIFVVCYSLQFYYSRGGWIRLNWKNGTKTLMKGHTNNDQSQVAYMGSVTERDNTIIANLSEATENMESIDCFVPQWNSDKWDQHQFKLDIKPPISPKFWEQEITEEIILEKHGMSRSGRDEMTCTLIQGKPTPKIIWKKDGIIVINWDTISLQGGKILTLRNETSETVRFWNVTEDLAGTYSCEAGESMKTFKIHVWGIDDSISGTRAESIVLISMTAIVCSLSLAVIIMFKMKGIRLRILRLRLF